VYATYIIISTEDVMVQAGLNPGNKVK